MSDPVDPLRERAETFWRNLPVGADGGALLRDLLADRASLQARIRELEQERDAANTQRDIAIGRMQKAEATAVHPEEARTLRAQLAAAEAREQAVKEVLAGFRADKARWDGLAEKVGPNNSDEADAGDMLRIVTSTLTNVIVKLDAALASTGQPQEGAK